MEYAIIGACIVAIVVVCVILLYKSKRKNESVSSTENMAMVTHKESRVDRIDRNAQELEIQMEMLPAESIPNVDKLVEITDSKILAHINHLMPGLMQARTSTNNTVRTAKAGGEVLYRSIIPAGAQLTDSKTMEGAARGFYRGTDGIRGHANLVAVESQKGTAVVANSAVAAMGVASMVVGQYYMTRIDAELNEISDGISKIVDFQDNEYRSRVFSLIAHVKKITAFQIEILENNELRLSKIAQLDSLEEECTKLLGQANLTLTGYAEKKNLEYDSYESEVKEAQDWYMYQKSLLDMLYKISDLRYALHLGAVSREQCVALLPTYTKQVADTQERLTKWHQDTMKYLNIDIEEVRRKRAGFDGVVHFIPGLFKDDFNFRSIKESTANMITSQATGYETNHLKGMVDLYSEDVQLILKDGKVYYLPKTGAE